MKVVIPMAGYGTRLRPHTYSRPKPLVNIAGEPMLKHVLASLDGLDIEEYIFIVGYLGDQIKAYINDNYDVKAQFVVQDEMIGQAHAIYLAKEFLQGPAVILFSDTLFDADVNAIKQSDDDGLLYVKEVEDPRAFGVVTLDDNGHITQFVEKSEKIVSHLAIIGMYYVRESEKLIAAIETQMERKQMTKGEFYIADALQIMVDEGAKFSTEGVNVWLDAGKPETVLETNRYLLSNGFNNTDKIDIGNSVVIPPVYIHPSAKLDHSIIGPNVTISKNCMIKHSVVRESIIDEGAEVKHTTLQHSLIGRYAKVTGRYHQLNVGDNSSLDFT